MITVYYTRIKEIWESELLYKKLYQLPQHVRERISTYKDDKQRQVRICGKLLLQRLLSSFDCDASLEGLSYDEYNRPYIEDTIDFNIAHSEDVIMCAGISYGRVGVDIEHILPIDLTLFQDHFNENDWQSIERSDDKYNTFFDLWTRVEALSKAIGKGVYGIPIDFQYLENSTNYGKFTVDELRLYNCYKAYVAYATQLSDVKINLIEVQINDL